jgi:SAM-dependent methyltransferase
MSEREGGDPRTVVTRGYDRLKERYYEWTTSNDPRYRLDYLGYLLELLPPAARVVELGCGPGLPVARAISEKHRFVGVDISAEQIAVARRNAPRGSYLRADMSQIEFRPGSLDAVAAFYSIFHLPRREHRALLSGISRWLRPGGVLAANLGAVDNPGAVEEWVDGVSMFWSSYDAQTNLDLVQRAGFELLRNEVLSNFEDGRQVFFLWILARKAQDSV